jgi:hypothetical protein
VNLRFILGFGSTNIGVGVHQHHLGDVDIAGRTVDLGPNSLSIVSVRTHTAKLVIDLLAGVMVESAGIPMSSLFHYIKWFDGIAVVSLDYETLLEVLKSAGSQPMFHTHRVTQIGLSPCRNNLTPVCQLLVVIRLWTPVPNVVEPL